MRDQGAPAGASALASPLLAALAVALRHWPRRSWAPPWVLSDVEGIPRTSDAMAAVAVQRSRCDRLAVCRGTTLRQTANFATSEYNGCVVRDLSAPAG
jgi:hypothetical protein